jgi:hypothetical protein
VPRGEALKIERAAYEIVRKEELERDWTPGPPLTKTEEAREGCDFLSTPPTGGSPDRVEVKGWGEPLLMPDGRFTYPADINVEQHERAGAEDQNWRLEIVANLTAARAGVGEVQRLTLTGAEVRDRARPWKYKVGLEGLENRIRVTPWAPS